MVLQTRGLDELDATLQKKTRVTFQSAPVFSARPKRSRTFDICVVAHLRDETDPLRAAHAAALLSSDSRIRILHVGAALTPEERADIISGFNDWNNHNFLNEKQLQVE